jgi:curved DNA-binding protein
LSDYYKILQVDPSADPDVINAAYRKLAEKHHPDRNPDPRSVERMKALNVARDVLLDPEQRARYDDARRRDAAASAPRAEGRQGPPGFAGQSGGGGNAPTPTPSRTTSSVHAPRPRREPRKLGHL